MTLDALRFYVLQPVSSKSEILGFGDSVCGNSIDFTLDALRFDCFRVLLSNFEILGFWAGKNFFLGRK